MTQQPLPPVIPPLVYIDEDYRHYLPEYGRGAGIMLNYDHEHEAWRIANILVVPRLRGIGLGTALLTAVTDWADQHGHTLMLFAEQIGDDYTLSTLQLIRWYNRHGFQHIRSKHQSALIRYPKGHSP